MSDFEKMKAIWEEMFLPHIEGYEPMEFLLMTADSEEPDDTDLFIFDDFFQFFQFSDTQYREGCTKMKIFSIIIKKSPERKLGGKIIRPEKKYGLFKIALE